MQHESREAALEAFVPVEGVADDRVAYAEEVGADLVFAPRERPDPDSVVSGRRSRTSYSVRQALPASGSAAMRPEPNRRRGVSMRPPRDNCPCTTAR